MTTDPRRWKLDGQKIVCEWQDWLASDEGKKCWASQASGVYLQNRLNMAFNAGMEAALKLLEDETRSSIY